MDFKSNTMLRYAGIIEESIVDGPGIRFVVFTQGCNFHCKGCQNPETWDASAGKVISIEEVLTQIKSSPLIDGITISGGEPFLQPEACYNLATQVKEMGLSVMVYTGFTYEVLSELDVNDPKRRFLSVVDILVDGQFKLENKSLNLLFRGSSNQRLLYLEHSNIVSISKE